MHTNHQASALTCREAAQFNKALETTGLTLLVIAHTCFSGVSALSLGMKTLEELAAWKTKKWMPWTCSWYPSKPATEASVTHIESALQVALPRNFVEFSKLVHNYGVWFGSIGDDYDSHNHLLRLNEAFHQPEDGDIALPERWVLINHGHDGDCDCFDVSGGSSPEYPIYYINVESPGEPVLMGKTFQEYLEMHA